MVIKTKFNMFEQVYIIHDPHQCKRLITGIRVAPGALLLQLSFGETFSEVYEQEVSTEKNQNHLFE